jgi:hypothetical protein
VSRTLFKEVTYGLDKLIADIQLGEIALPDIQRPFVWSNAQVRDLFDSMYKGFPVGYFLFWENGVPDGHRQIGTGSKAKVPRLLIVDGQQRLTSLFAVLKAVSVIREDYSRDLIHIAFRPRDRTFEVADAAIRRDSEFIPDISRIWAADTSRNRFVKDFLERLRKHRPVAEDEEDDLIEAIDGLYDLKTYPFTAAELSSAVDEERVAEVFVRINSKGKSLNQADFILTLMSVFWDEGRKELESWCRAAHEVPGKAASPYNVFVEPQPDQILRVSVGLGFRRARLQHVYSILRGKDLETGEFSDERRVKQFAVLQEAQTYVLNLTNWHEFLKAILRAGYRSGDMISSQVGLLYAYALFLIGRRDFKVDHATLREVIARWFFMSALTGRYTSSAETVMEEDLARVSSARNAGEFVSILTGVIESIFTQDFWSMNMPNELRTAAARTPSLFGYYAALNLLDARVLFSHLKVSELLDPTHKAKKAALERHHLYPKAYLSRLGLTKRREVNQLANFALVEWPDNIDISDKAPAEYFPAYVAKYRSKDGKEVEAMLRWHALPDGWERLDYDAFLEMRRRAIAHVIREGYERLLASSGH